MKGTSEVHMTGKRHTDDEIADKVRQVEALVGQGKTLGEATKLVGVSRQTMYRWREGRNGGDGVDIDNADDASDRLRELETENARLRKLVTDLLLEKMAIEETRFRK
jgi:putative transposase